MPKGIRTSSNIFNKVLKSSKNHPKSLEVAGTFLEILVMARWKSQTFDSEKVGRTIEHQPFKWKVLDLNYSWTIKQGL